MQPASGTRVAAILSGVEKKKAKQGRKENRGTNPSVALKVSLVQDTALEGSARLRARVVRTNLSLSGQRKGKDVDNLELVR
jgi:hypothetical protein